MNLKYAGRWLARLSIMLVSVFLVLGGPMPLWIGRLLPAFSPLATLSSALAQREWYPGLYWGLPALAMILLASAKGRFFCNWICPLGTACAAAGKVPGPRRRMLRRPVAGYLFWIIAGSSLAGLPIFLFLDPLATSNRAVVVAGGVYHTAALIPGLLLPAILIAGIFQPMIWCSHICPLGYFNSLSQRLRMRPAQTLDRERREALIGLGLGIPLGLILPRIAFGTRRHPILPPGALAQNDFAAVCTRCGACIRSCPTGILRFNISGERGLTQLFQPEMDANHGGCEEFCNSCTQVCPSGAIHPLSIDQKRYRQIGKADVVREACLAWSDGEHCMVCAEFCPYLAIDMIPQNILIESDDGKVREEAIPCPVVDPDVCRGCGVCQYNCPAVRKGRAIIVSGIESQKTLPESELLG